MYKGDVLSLSKDSKDSYLLLFLGACYSLSLYSILYRRQSMSFLAGLMY